MTEAYGDELFRRRNQLHLTQQQLAERAGVNRVTIRAIEHGREVSEATRVKVQSALDSFSKPSGTGDVELLALDVIVAAVARLDVDERKRIMHYLNDRYGDGGGPDG